MIQVGCHISSLALTTTPDAYAFEAIGAMRRSEVWTN